MTHVRKPTRRWVLERRYESGETWSVAWLSRYSTAARALEAIPHTGKHHADYEWRARHLDTGEAVEFYPRKPSYAEGWSMAQLLSTYLSGQYTLAGWHELGYRHLVSLCGRLSANTEHLPRVRQWLNTNAYVCTRFCQSKHLQPIQNTFTYSACR